MTLLKKLLSTKSIDDAKAPKGVDAKAHLRICSKTLESKFESSYALWRHYNGARNISDIFLKIQLAHQQNHFTSSKFNCRVKRVIYFPKTHLVYEILHTYS